VRSSVPALLLALGACDSKVVRNVGEGYAFVRWPSDDLVLVGSEMGLAAIEPDAGEVEWITTGPVLVADADADGRVLYAETFFPDPDFDYVICVASCSLDIVRVDRDGTDSEVLVPGVYANVEGTFVPSSDRRFLAFETPAGIEVLDLSTGERVEGPGANYLMSLSDDGSEVVYMDRSAPPDEPWVHYSLFHMPTGEVTPINVNEDASEITRWNYWDGDHRAIVDDGAGFGVAALATGTRDWTYDSDVGVYASPFAWNPGSAWITFYTDDGVVHVLDAVTGDEVERIWHPMPRDDFYGGTAAVAPDGDRVAWLANGQLHLTPIRAR